MSSATDNENRVRRFGNTVWYFTVAKRDSIDARCLASPKSAERKLQQLAEQREQRY
ncbi:MAG: hypothetical protein R3C17_16020 [Planctomycetaceae bacterium]